MNRPKAGGNLRFDNRRSLLFDNRRFLRFRNRERFYFGSRYLLKTTPNNQSAFGQASIAGLALLWLLLEERIYGALRIADDKPLLLWTGFILLAFRIRFFRHLILLSQWFPFGVDVVPQPGIGPGRPNWARACKARSSANSDTGAQSTLNVGAVMLAKASPVPTCSGPISAALLPSSSLNASLNYSERNVIVCNFYGFPSVKHPPFPFLAINLFFGAINKPTQNFVNAGHRRCESREIKSLFVKQTTNILGRQLFSRSFQDGAYRVGDSQSRKFVPSSSLPANGARFFSISSR